MFRSLPFHFPIIFTTAVVLIFISFLCETSLLFTFDLMKTRSLWGIGWRRRGVGLQLCCRGCDSIINLLHPKWDKGCPSYSDQVFPTKCSCPHCLLDFKSTDLAGKICRVTGARVSLSYRNSALKLPETGSVLTDLLSLAPPPV